MLRKDFGIGVVMGICGGDASWISGEVKFRSTPPAAGCWIIYLMIDQQDVDIYDKFSKFFRQRALLF